MEPYRVFDVQEAMVVLRAAPRPPQPLPVTPWAQAYGLIPGPGASPHSIPLLGPSPGPGFDRGYAMTTDLAKPLIIATAPVPGGDLPTPRLIDGYALLVTVHSEVAVVQWSVPESVGLATPADSTMR